METVDLLLTDGRIIDVLYPEILPPTSVAINDGKIVDIGGSYKARKEINVRGKFLAPGFGDLHIHLESTMVRPKYVIKTMLSHGTTYLVHDPHEAANVQGLYGIMSMLAETENLPCYAYMTVPSCVPATPRKMGLETGGYDIGVKETEILMRCPEVVGLGEVMDILGVLNREETIMKKMEIAKKYGKYIDGHGAGLDRADATRYFSAGPSSDHEVTSFEEFKIRDDLGVWVYGREGSASHDLERIIPGIVKKGENTDKLAFCVDDLSAYDLIHRGHIDHCMRQSIKLGMDPAEAVRIGSYNGCRRLGKENFMGVIKEGYIADLVVISTRNQTEKTFDRFEVDKTIWNGKLVFSRDEGLVYSPKKKFEPVSNSVNLAKKYEPKDFTINLGPKYASKEVPVRVIGVEDETIETKELIEKMYTDKDGILHSDPEIDILPAFVVGRHSASRGNVGRGFVKGIGIKKKIPYAISSSFAHDCHNIIVTGTNPLDISTAVNKQQDIGGGIVLVEKGKVTREIPLRYFGLMSTETPEQVYNEQKMFNERLHELGSKLNSPAATLSFVPLTVIPELRLTDKGLVKNYKIVPLIVENQNN